MSKIITNTHKLSTLTSNILLLSKIENQEIMLEKETFLLDEQIRETILIFENAWEEKEIELNIELPTVSYYGNKELLAQVWQNLISNAVKFAGENGEISIELEQHTNQICISVSDNGIGMSEEIMTRVFEKFYQADSSRASKGNGLGLALARRVVVLHNGEITAKSKENKGSKFIVTLPFY